MLGWRCYIGHQQDPSPCWATAVFRAIPTVIYPGPLSVRVLKQSCAVHLWVWELYGPGAFLQHLASQTPCTIGKSGPQQGKAPCDT